MCVSDMFLRYVFLNPFTPLMLGGILPHFNRIQNHSNYFLIYTRRNSRRVISIKLASIKPRFDVTRNVSVTVVSLDFVDERIGIGIGIQQLTTLPPPSLTCNRHQRLLP